MKELQTLPGTEHARFALPLEYEPSRELKSRWGYARPPIEPLLTWFASRAEQYRSFLGTMRGFLADLADVPHDLDAARLPTPGWFGGAMNPVDSLALYSFVRTCAPATYLEIGSGLSTCFAHLARQHGRLRTRIVSIDPQPRSAIDAICDQSIRAGLETCDLSIFDALAEGDIVFMDGSHRSFMNSDVTVFFIDVLPRLKPGVVVHLHDIALPYDYHPFFTNWYWNEQYLLAVYLMGNKARIDPLLPLAFVTRDERFKGPIDLFPQPFRLEGGSLWFTHI
jgi:hypothetical protein